MIIFIKSVLLLLIVSFWSAPGCRQTSATEESVKHSSETPAQANNNVKIETPGNTPLPSPNQQNPTDQIAPAYCRVVGQIVSVLPALLADKKDPCGKVPCQAKVKIKKVIGYGSAFGSPLGEGALITVTFSFTLHPTQKYFPELTTHLPGLKVGQTFQADMREVGDNKTKTYQVNEYQVK